MFKYFASFVVILIAIGISLQVYLPSYNPDINLEEDGYTIDTVSMARAIPYESIQPAQAYIQQETADTRYGLQLALYKSLDNAKIAAQRLADPNVGKLPTIFKIQQQQEIWYMLIVGPFASKTEALSWKQAIAETNQHGVLVLWPEAED